MKNHIYYLIAGLLIICSCNKKLDATTEKTLWASAETLANSLREGEKEEFIKAFDAVGRHYLFIVDSEEEMRRIFHKKTAKQIVNLANEIETERLEEKLASQPKIDASTNIAFINSRENAERVLSWDDKKEFEDALELIYETYSGMDSEKRLLNRFHNKTPAEIIEDSKKIQGKRVNRSRKKKPWD